MNVNVQEGAAAELSRAESPNLGGGLSVSAKSEELYCSTCRQALEMVNGGVSK